LYYIPKLSLKESASLYLVQLKKWLDQRRLNATKIPANINPKFPPWFARAPEPAEPPETPEAGLIAGVGDGVIVVVTSVITVAINPLEVGAGSVVGVGVVVSVLESGVMRVGVLVSDVWGVTTGEGTCCCCVVVGMIFGVVVVIGGGGGCGVEVVVTTTLELEVVVVVVIRAGGGGACLVVVVPEPPLLPPLPLPPFPFPLPLLLLPPVWGNPTGH